VPVLFVSDANSASFLVRLRRVRLLFLDFFSRFETLLPDIPELGQPGVTKHAAYSKYQIGTAHA